MENKAYTMKVACLDRLTMKGTCKLSERWSLLDLTNIWLSLKLWICQCFCIHLQQYH